MFIRQYFKDKNGQRTAYWALVESHRTKRGPRQRVVAWLGKLDEAGRLGVGQAIDNTDTTTGLQDKSTRGHDRQQLLFKDDENTTKPRWEEVNVAGVRVENTRQFGGPWLALHLIRLLQLDTFLQKAIPEGREHVPWDVSSLILIITRLLKPSSELYIAEQWYPKTALPELLGVPAKHVDDNRLYRTLDEVFPHKEALEIHLKQRAGDLFDLEYDLLMYDVTSTFFEGRADFPLAQRGYSRDQRSDCKQVCIALVVSRCGMPLGYEVFAGNTADVTTVEHVVETMERRYGKSERIWVMDRGMVSEDNIKFLRDGGRRYIIGTPKATLKNFEQEILKNDWHAIRDGLEVKIVPWPKDDERDDESADATANVNGDAADSKHDQAPETFILCRSRDRSKKEEAMTQRFETKIQEALVRLKAGCEKKNRDVQKVERQIGRLLAKNSRASKLFDIKVSKAESGGAIVEWSKVDGSRNWATLSAGCYLLRTNVSGWTDEELWKAYIQLTEAEAAFRIQKSDLSIRPIWHQKEDRVLDELSEIYSMDVVLPTKSGLEIRTRCVSKPSDHQQILLDKLGLNLPSKINLKQM